MRCRETRHIIALVCASLLIAIGSPILDLGNAYLEGPR